MAGDGEEENDLLHRRAARDARRQAELSGRGLHSFAAGPLTVLLSHTSEQPVVMTLRDARTGQQLTVKVSGLDLDMLAYGLSKHAARIVREEQRS